MLAPFRDQSPADILQNTLLFSSVDIHLLELLASKASLKTYPKNKILFLSEDAADYFYIIADGWVKLFRETLDGEEALVDVLNTGHIFGETAIFEHDLYAYGAEVVEESTLVALPLSLLKQQIEENRQLSMQMRDVTLTKTTG
jgi:CRP-like cAMP-binding protein